MVRCTTAILFTTALLSFLAAPAHGVQVEGTSAMLAWAPAQQESLVQGYEVWVTRNGVNPTTAELVVSAPTATVGGGTGDTIQVRVAAFDGLGNRGPFSPDSVPIEFVAPPPPPDPIVVSSDGDLAVSRSEPGTDDWSVRMQGQGRQLLVLGEASSDGAGSGAPADPFGFGQLVVGADGQATVVRLVDLEAAAAGSTGALQLFGLGSGDECPRSGEDGLRILGGSTLVLGGLEVLASIDGECVRLNDLFPGSGPDPNVIAFDGGFIQLIGDLDQDDSMDPVDNCLAVENPDQCDSNLDGFGNACDGDLDGDGLVTQQDLFVHFVASFGKATPPASPDADLDCDGLVGILDLRVMLTGAGGPPGPSGLACAGTIPCEASP